MNFLSKQVAKGASGPGQVLLPTAAESCPGHLLILFSFSLGYPSTPQKVYKSAIECNSFSCAWIKPQCLQESGSGRVPLHPASRSGMGIGLGPNLQLLTQTLVTPKPFPPQRTESSITNQEVGGKGRFYLLTVWEIFGCVTHATHFIIATTLPGHISDSTLPVRTLKLGEAKPLVQASGGRQILQMGAEFRSVCLSVCRKGPAVSNYTDSTAPGCSRRSVLGSTGHRQGTWA